MKRFTRIPFLFGVGAIFALYARCIFFSFIGLDDAAYTFRNPFVAGGLAAQNVVEAFVNLRHGGIWMPVTYISYMCDASLCRLAGFPLIGEMHLVNVILHTVNFILLWKLIRLLFGFSAWDGMADRRQLASIFPLTTTIATLAVMVWAVHPLRVEPVAWIAARKELLWSLFTLLGLICWIKGGERRERDEGAPRNPRLSTINYWLPTIICCALACLSKPTAMCFPFLLLLVMWRMRRQQPAPTHRLSSLICHLSLMFLIAAATAAIAAYSQTHVAGQDQAALYAAPVGHRLVHALSAVGYYIRATFWPIGLHADCRAIPGLWPLDAGWNFAAISIAAVAALLCCIKGRELIIFSALWFLLPLLPTLGLFGSFGMEAHADRFAYLPSISFSFLLLGLSCHLVSSPAAKCQLPTILLLAVLSFLTFRQLAHWRDDGAIHARTLACDPGHPRAMVHVADARCSRHRDFNGGIAWYRKALALAGTVPAGGFDVADTKARLAYALATRGGHGDFAEVKRLGGEVLQNFTIDRRGMMLDALGTAFMAEGDCKRAARLFKASIDAPDRFWPTASTRRKLERCR